MNSKVLYGLAAAVTLGFIGAVVGLIAGTGVGGNSASDFEFLGGVGYEATGYVGAILGAVIGAIVGALLGIRFALIVKKRKVKD